MKMPFGKHKGKPLEEICNSDPGYLKWMLREDVGSEELREEAAALLEARQGTTSRGPIASPNTKAVGEQSNLNYGLLVGIGIVLLIVYLVSRGNDGNGGPGDGGPTPTPTRTKIVNPSPTPTDDGLCIDAEQAAKKIGENRCVEFSVVRTYNSGKAVFLNSRPNEGYFYVVIFPERWNCWPEPPEGYFRQKRIRVQGKIELYNGSPEIIIRDCSQINIVE